MHSHEERRLKELIATATNTLFEDWEPSAENMLKGLVSRDTVWLRNSALCGTAVGCVYNDVQGSRHYAVELRTPNGRVVESVHHVSYMESDSREAVTDASFRLKEVIALATGTALFNWYRIAKPDCIDKDPSLEASGTWYAHEASWDSDIPVGLVAYAHLSDAHVVDGPATVWCDYRIYTEDGVMITGWSGAVATLTAQRVEDLFDDHWKALTFRSIAARATGTKAYRWKRLRTNPCDDKLCRSGETWYRGPRGYVVRLTKLNTSVDIEVAVLHSKSCSVATIRWPMSLNDMGLLDELAKASYMRRVSDEDNDIEEGADLARKTEKEGN